MTEGSGRPGPGSEGPSPGRRKSVDARDEAESGTGVPEEEEAVRQAPTCEICGAPVLERHCKVICLNCGYTRDCSDP